MKSEAELRALHADLDLFIEHYAAGNGFARGLCAALEYILDLPPACRKPGCTEDHEGARAEAIAAVRRRADRIRKTLAAAQKASRQ